MNEYRCTRLAPYLTLQPDERDNCDLRQGYYILAATREEALRRMAKEFPDDAAICRAHKRFPFTCKLWKEDIYSPVTT